MAIAELRAQAVGKLIERVRAIERRRGCHARVAGADQGRADRASPAARELFPPEQFANVPGRAGDDLPPRRGCRRPLRALRLGRRARQGAAAAQPHHLGGRSPASTATSTTCSTSAPTRGETPGEGRLRADRRADGAARQRLRHAARRFPHHRGDRRQASRCTCTSTGKTLEELPDRIAFPSSSGGGAYARFMAKPDDRAARASPPRELRAMMLRAGDEFALSSTCARKACSPRAICSSPTPLPLSRLELRVAALVPRLAHAHRADGRRRGASRSARRAAARASATATSRAGGRATRPGRRRATRSSPASTCRRRRSARSSSTTTTRRASTRPSSRKLATPAQDW